MRHDCPRGRAPTRCTVVCLCVVCATARWCKMQVHEFKFQICSTAQKSASMKHGCWRDTAQRQGHGGTGAAVARGARAKEGVERCLYRLVKPSLSSPSRMPKEWPLMHHPSRLLLPPRGRLANFTQTTVLPPWLDRGRISAASRPHLGRISAASRPHLGRISPLVAAVRW